MKRFLLSLAMIAFFCGAYASVTTPIFYSEDFFDMGQKYDYPTDGWTTYGNGATPTDLMQNFFKEKDNPYILLNYGENCLAMACTEFVPATNADQWLISPEIEISSDTAELFFQACNYAGQGNFGVGPGTFKVLVSESGTAKEDFSEVPVIENSVMGSVTTEIVMKKFCAPLNGHGGKKIHLAFVATGKGVGMTGFTDIRIGDYIMNIENYTTKVGEIGEKYGVRVNIGLKTSVTCPGVNTVLYVNDENVAENYFKKPFGNSGTNLINLLIDLKDVIEITDTKAVNYRLEITPDVEGLPASVVTGTIGVPQLKYISNVVVEEGTATGCGWCPRGIGSMEYYLDNYPGTEEQGKAICIAVHGNMNYTDPMNSGVEDYITKLMVLNASTTLPQAIFNRATRGLDPTQKSAFEEQIAKTSNNWLKINKVGYGKSEVVVTDEDGKPVLDDKGVEKKKNVIDVTVDFDAKNSYSATGLNLNAAAVIIENGVKGNNSGYIQENYLYSHDASWIRSLYGDWLVPYVSDFIVGGDRAVSMIPFDQMTYDHVARGIYPSFYGQELTTEWTADEVNSDTITFEVPENVIDFENTEVVVLMTDDSHAIVASDIIPFSEFVFDGSGVNTITEAANVSVEGSVINVVANAGTEVAIYAIDGTLLGKYLMNADTLAIDASAWQGITIVKVADKATKVIL